MPMLQPHSLVACGVPPFPSVKDAQRRPASVSVIEVVDARDLSRGLRVQAACSVCVERRIAQHGRHPACAF